MNKVDFTQPGGMPLFLEGLDFSQKAARDTFYAMLSMYGLNTTDGFIISGCVATGDNTSGYNITEGYIAVGGEILKVDAHTVGALGIDTHYYWAIAESNDPLGALTFADTSVKNVYKVRKAIVTKGIFGSNPPIMPMLADTIYDRFNQRNNRQEVIVPIGTWNMVSAGSKTVTHGVDLSGKVVTGCEAFIFADSDLTDRESPIPLQSYYYQGYVLNVNSSAVQLGRADGGPLATTDYNDTSASRGYIVLRYRDK